MSTFSRSDITSDYFELDEIERIALGGVSIKIYELIHELETGFQYTFYWISLIRDGIVEFENHAENTSKVGAFVDGVRVGLSLG